MHDFEIYLLNSVPKYLPVRLIKLGTAVRPYSSKTPTAVPLARGTSTGARAYGRRMVAPRIICLEGTFVISKIVKM